MRASASFVAPSSSGLGRRPLTAKTRVRVRRGHQPSPMLGFGWQASNWAAKAAAIALAKAGGSTKNSTYRTAFDGEPRSRSSPPSDLRAHSGELADARLALLALCPRGARRGDIVGRHQYERVGTPDPFSARQHARAEPRDELARSIRIDRPAPPARFPGAKRGRCGARRRPAHGPPAKRANLPDAERPNAGRFLARGPQPAGARGTGTGGR